MKSWLKIHPADTVAVALVSLPAGTAVSLGLRLREAIPQGHKFALADIPAGEPVVKYGQPIGTAKTDIPAGSVLVSELCEPGGIRAHGLHGQRVQVVFPAPRPLRQKRPTG